MNLPELIRIDFAGLRALARADGVSPLVLGALADSRLMFYGQRALADAIAAPAVPAVPGQREGAAWWDRSACPIQSLKDELERLVCAGDMAGVLKVAAMIYVRECADGAAQSREGA